MIIDENSPLDEESLSAEYVLEEYDFLAPLLLQQLKIPLIQLAQKIIVSFGKFQNQIVRHLIVIYI